MAKRRRRHLTELPVRQCRYGERCLVCLRDIDPGGGYHDGGLWRRVHLHCAEAVAAGQGREPTRAEVRELERAELDIATARGWLYRATKGDPTAPSIEGAKNALRAAGERVQQIRNRWAK